MRDRYKDLLTQAINSLQIIFLQLLETAKRAIEIAIEQDEEVAMRFTEEAQPALRN